MTDLIAFAAGVGLWIEYVHLGLLRLTGRGVRDNLEALAWRADPQGRLVRWWL